MAQKERFEGLPPYCPGVEERDGGKFLEKAFPVGGLGERAGPGDPALPFSGSGMGKNQRGRRRR